jgi:diaminopropionate ammonia-lyase
MGAVLTSTDLDEAAAYYRRQPDAPATPLHRLTGLADELGLGELLVKDESNRFGLPAFKIAGARYAIARLVAETDAGDLACATTGNHGRAVARAGRQHGRRTHVYVPRGTAAARIDALRAEDAHVTVTDTDYDETVRRMADEAAREGWTIVSDTAWEGYERVPRWIMAGYTWIMEEARADWGPVPPDLVIVQAGVGSLAAAVAAWLVIRLGPDRPAFAVAEPTGSACVGASLAAGRPVVLPSCAPTSMAGLRCAEMSSLAWPILRDVVRAAVTVSDAEAEAMVARLARPAAGDVAIAAGPSGAAGLAALQTLLRAPELTGTLADLALPGRARALAIVTEGPTA